MHLVRAGGKEAHQLVGTQSSLIPVIRVSESQIRGSALPRQHNGNSLHKENGGHLLPVPVQGELSVVASGHHEKHHHFIGLPANSLKPVIKTQIKEHQICILIVVLQTLTHSGHRIFAIFGKFILASIEYLIGKKLLQLLVLPL